MNTFLKEITVQQGFEVAALQPSSRVVAGKEISLASGFRLFKHLLDTQQPIKCWQCGCEADRWLVQQHRNDNKNKPVMNLYGTVTVNGRPELRMLTRDHIIPASLGGVDDVENLRPGCDLCNGQRGNSLGKFEREFMKHNPHLIDDERKRRAEERARIHEAQVQKQRADNINEINQRFVLLSNLLMVAPDRVMDRTSSQRPSIIIFLNSIGLLIYVRKHSYLIRQQDRQSFVYYTIDDVLQHAQKLYERPQV